MPALKIKIARQLAASRVGLHRIELFSVLHRRLIADKIDAIAAALQGMERAGDIQSAGARWRLTAKGRAAYSALNSDETAEADGIRQKAEKINLLEILESQPILTDETRQLLAGIRADLAALDAAD